MAIVHDGSKLNMSCHTWVGSSKRVKLHGTFVAKPASICSRPLNRYSSKEIIIQLPTLKFWVDQEQVDVSRRKRLWNRISGRIFKTNCRSPPACPKTSSKAGMPAEAERNIAATT